jgi:hypothetical protein
VYDKGFFVGLDVDMDSEEGFGRTGRLNSQPKKNYIDNHRLLTYEKFSLTSAFACARSIVSLPLSLSAIYLGNGTIVSRVFRFWSSTTAES